MSTKRAFRPMPALSGMRLQRLVRSCSLFDLATAAEISPAALSHAERGIKPLSEEAEARRVRALAQFEEQEQETAP